MYWIRMLALVVVSFWLCAASLPESDDSEEPMAVEVSETEFSGGSVSEVPMPIEPIAPEPVEPEIDEPAVPAPYVPKSSKPQLTRLRVAPGYPIGEFKKKNKGTTVERIEAKVRNVGTVDATKVKVEFILSSGKVVRLSGPSTLAKNKSAMYTAKPKAEIFSSQRLKVKLQCANCRK